MEKFVSGVDELHYLADKVSEIMISVKNYRIYISENDGTEITVRYKNNRFRKMNITESNSSIYMEEKVTVTLYGLFRFIELMEDNILEITVPHGYNKLNISIETGVTEINVQKIGVENIRITSGTGKIYIEDVRIGNSLTANSSAGKVFCQLPDAISNYNIDCRVNRKDKESPIFPPNPSAKKKISLLSGMFVPELIFLRDC